MAKYPLSETKQKVYRKLRIVAFLSVVAMFVTAYLAYLHYAGTGESFCDISEKINCDVVNKSVYSEFLGVPVAIWGFLAYFVILVISMGVVAEFDFSKIYSKLRPKFMLKLLLFITFVGTGFSLYLSYVEFFILKTVCILCVTQQIIIFIMFILSMAILVNVDQGEKDKKICEFC